uniref:Uncharacterized protein AlNc14C634G12305 n=1 Tax=Albugo laibachii Nc14 TaxID=890382 RepID=F0X1K1_9STRA|nr:hypothetical protein DDB_G0291394 [Albugo laibachii Nc14]|eukprot:CCA27692.1 hypothetical protein DDB_G0291394 [Albugo laibachii Nc14]
MLSNLAFIVFHMIFCVYSRGDIGPSPQEQYNESIAIYLARVSASVYCPAAMILTWGCSPCSASGPLQSPRVVADGKNDFQGIVGYSPNMNAIVIGFHGSSNIRNWITNFHVLKKEAYEAYPEALVHQGFYQLYQQVAEQLFHHI